MSRNTIEIFIKIELLAADIYSEFSRNNLSDEEIKAVWLQMSRDEEDHANALKLASRLPQSEFSLNGPESLPSPEESLETLNTILARTKTQRCSIGQMLNDAVRLENLFRKIHAKYVLAFKNESMKKTFSMLARADEKHIECLKKYIDEYKKQ